MYSPSLKQDYSDPFMDKLLFLAINHNPTLAEQWAAISEAHYERLADVTQGRPYFRVHDLVRHIRSFSYGSVQQIRPSLNNYLYLIAWFDSPHPWQWQWIPSDSLTLLPSFF